MPPAAPRCRSRVPGFAPGFEGMRKLASITAECSLQHVPLSLAVDSGWRPIFDQREESGMVLLSQAASLERLKHLLDKRRHR